MSSWGSGLISISANIHVHGSCGAKPWVVLPAKLCSNVAVQAPRMQAAHEAAESNELASHFAIEWALFADWYGLFLGT